MYKPSEIRKALVPVGVAAVIAVLTAVGINEDMTVMEAATFGVTALLTFFIPNRPKQ